MPPLKNDHSTAPSAELIEALLRELRENSVALATFSAEQRALKEKLSSLSTALFPPDPGKSVVTRLALLEVEIDDLKKADDKHETKIDRLNDTSQTFILEDRKDKREKNRARLQLWIGIITAIIGAAVAIVTTILSHRK